MNNRALLIVGVLVLFVGGGLFWNYTAAIKDRNQLERDKLSQEKEIEEMKIRAEEAAQTKAETEKATVEIMRDQCLKNASDSYRASWARACESVADVNFERRQSCISDNKKHGWDIDCNLWTEDRDPDCSLPSARADSVNEYHKEAKEECYKKYPVN